MTDDPEEPRNRVLVGVFAILAWLILWIFLAVSAATAIEGWPVLIQMVFYLVAGIGWIVPLKPALRWMYAGR